MSTKPENEKQAVEGEGSYRATRAYNQHLADAIDGDDLEAGAESARRAMEGPEREELEQAAARAKAGPKAPVQADNEAKASPAAAKR